MSKPLSPSLPSKPFRKTHGEQIQLVTDFSWVNADKLKGIGEEINDILSESAYISDERRKVLCGAVRRRIELLDKIVMKQNGDI